MRRHGRQTLAKEWQLTLAGMTGACHACNTLDSVIYLQRFGNCHFVATKSITCIVDGGFGGDSNLGTVKFDFSLSLGPGEIPGECCWTFRIIQTLNSQLPCQIVEGKKCVAKPFACDDSFTLDSVTFTNCTTQSTLCTFSGQTFSFVPVADPS